MAMSEAQATHLQSLTTALTRIADAVDAVQEALRDSDADAMPPVIRLDKARDIARRVLASETYDMAADAVRADWAAAGGGPIEDGG